MTSPKHLPWPRCWRSTSRHLAQTRDAAAHTYHPAGHPTIKPKEEKVPLMKLVHNPIGDNGPKMKVVFVPEMKAILILCIGGGCSRRPGPTKTVVNH